MLDNHSRLTLLFLRRSTYFKHTSLPRFRFCETHVSAQVDGARSLSSFERMSFTSHNGMLPVGHESRREHPFPSAAPSHDTRGYT